MLVDKIIEAENNFAEVQATVMEKPYGKIFYDKDNPLSYDSNHAIINEGADYNFAMEDIVQFYRSLGLTPRVYTFSTKESPVGQFLEMNGFQKTTDEICFFAQIDKKMIDVPKTLEVKRLHHVDEEIQQLLDSDKEQGEWGYKSLVKSIDKENFYLFGGYEDESLVCKASLYKLNDVSRINDVFTRFDKRGKGYGSQLINFITQFNEHTLNTTSYLYATNPNAIHVYKKAGYEEMDAMIRGCYWL